MRTDGNMQVPMCLLAFLIKAKQMDAIHNQRSSIMSLILRQNRVEAYVASNVVGFLLYMYFSACMQFIQATSLVSWAHSL